MAMRVEATGIPTEPARPKWEAHQDRNQVKGQQKQLHISCHSHEILEPHLHLGKGTKSFRSKSSFFPATAEVRQGSWNH